MKNKTYRPMLESLEERMTPSNTVAYVPEPTPETLVAAPSNLAAEVQDKQIVISWTDTSNNETDFAVYRTNNGQTWKLVATLPQGLEPLGTMSCVDSTVHGHKTCTYIVIAYNESYVSSHYDVVSVTIPKGR